MVKWCRVKTPKVLCEANPVAG